MHTAVSVACHAHIGPDGHAPTETNGVVSAAVWGSLLGLALVVAINPVLLAVILLMISRPRPMQNLLAYWLGGTIVNFVCLLIPLVVLHVTPAFNSFLQGLVSPASGANRTAQHIQLGMGVLMLTIAGLLTVHSLARRRARVPAAGGNGSTLVLDPPDEPIAISPLGPLGRAAQGADGESSFRRLLGRLQTAWENGALWVAFVFGLGGLPPPVLVLFIDTSIVASRSAIGTQLGAVIVYVVGVFAVVELTLVCYLVAPAKTQALLRPLHNWAFVHRRQVLIGIFAVVGAFQVVKGSGIA